MASEQETIAVSKYAWWVAMLANELTMCRREQLTPEVGDIICEVSHTLGLAKHALGREDAIGELIATRGGKVYGPAYLIKNPAGREVWWENARIVVIQKREAA